MRHSCRVHSASQSNGFLPGLLDGDRDMSGRGLPEPVALFLERVVDPLLSSNYTQDNTQHNLFLSS
jgi:hypothetical protein